MLSDSLAKDNITLRVILAPTASQILSDKLPVFAPNVNQSAVIECARKQGLEEIVHLFSVHSLDFLVSISADLTFIL